MTRNAKELPQGRVDRVVQSILRDPEVGLGTPSCQGLAYEELETLVAQYLRGGGSPEQVTQWFRNKAEAEWVGPQREMKTQLMRDMVRSPLLVWQGGHWAPAACGTEQPARTSSGDLVLYGFNIRTGEHRYLNLTRGTVLTLEDYQRLVGDEAPARS